MFVAFINHNAVARSAAQRRVNGVSSAPRLIHTNKNPHRHDALDRRAVAAPRPAKRPVLVAHWHVVPATGRLACSWSEQPSNGISVEQPCPRRRRGGISRGAKFDSTAWPGLRRAA